MKKRKNISIRNFIVIGILVFTSLLFLLGFFSFNNHFHEFYSKIFGGNSEILSAVATTEVFDTISSATILQYPVISYSDTRAVPFESTFQTIRKYSDPTKFTNHLCNPVNESNAAWRNDTLGCAGYNRDPKFIKLNFGSSNQKLMLYNNFSLFSVNSPSRVIKFQSLHLDRFTDSNFTGCNFKYDPRTIYPVFSGGVFYLYSKFNGLIDSRCVQFYDHIRNARSLGSSTDRLLLGFQVLSNGELNRGFNRTNYGSINGIPYGPGPQNSSSYAFSIPTNEVIGCSKFDSSNNCSQIIGVSQFAYSYTPTGTLQTGACTRQCKNPNNRDIMTCTAGWNCDIVSCPSCCRRTTQHPCNSNPLPNCWPNWNRTSYKRCVTVSYYTACCPNSTPKYYTGGTFSAHLNSYSLNSFTNLSSQEIKYNITGPTGPNPVVLNEPDDYQKYKNEFNNPNNINFPVHFTNEMNNTVFVSDKYLYKVEKNNTSVVIRRYTIDTSRTYGFGGSTYINSSAVTVSITLTSSSLNKFSLDYYKDDIYFLASSTDSHDFYKLQNFNSNSSVTAIKINELTNKFPVNYKVPSSFGIIPEGDTAIFYFSSNNKVFYTSLKSEVITTVIVNPTYKNFEFNGAVFSKESLNPGFMFTIPASKFVGSYVTSNSFSSNLKFLNNSTVLFNYSGSLLTNLFNFTSFNGTNFNKFNFLFNDVNFTENVPLADSQYFQFSNPNSTNKFEIIYISEGRGLKLDLTNENITKNYNKYVLINSDKNNKSRINFYIDCSSASYSLICSGTKFNFKGAVLGQFYISGKTNSTTDDRRFIRIHENADILIHLASELRSKKYQTVTSSIVNLIYE